MKKLLLLSVFISISVFVYSQKGIPSPGPIPITTNHVSYTYDAAGNRVSRTTVILEKPEDKGNKSNTLDIKKNPFIEGSIVIAPNPTTGTLYISFNDIELVEDTGRKVLSQKVQSNREELNLTNNPSGTYILKIVSGKHKIDYTVIKE